MCDAIINGFNPLERVPEGGWKRLTYYVVKVQLYPGNFIHRAILYTGFLDKNGIPSGYACYLEASYGATLQLDQYPNAIIEVVSEVPDIGEGKGD
jgi:hypothetical protein